MRALFAALMCLCLAAPAAAKVADNTQYLRFRNAASTNSLNMLEGVALNATEATRTLTLQVNQRWAKVRVAIFFTHSAATTVTATPKCSTEAGGTYANYQTRSCSSGTCSTFDMVDSNAVAGDEDFILEYDVRGCWEFDLVLSGASAGGSDLVDVQAVAVTGE